MNEPTHASFFSGAGGLDLGLERAGWRTVSFSEIDPYASAVLAQRWPGVPNLGDITEIAVGVQRDQRPDDGRDDSDDARRSAEHDADGPSAVHDPLSRQSDQGSTRLPDGDGSQPGPDGRLRERSGRDADWTRADLWSGGFPCQDLSVAGKRRGLAGSRSGLAFSFLDLVGRHRPRFVLLENVPGLLSSHGGKDFGTLLATLVELGYGVGYRVLDARYFGVPQRRRRVFILGDSTGGRAGAERAAEVLSVGSRCHRHPPTGIEAGPGAAAGARPGVDIARAVTGTSGKRHDDDTDTLVPTLTVGGRASGAGSSYDNTPWTLIRPSPDSRGVRKIDGLARRSHDRDGVAATLNSGGNDGGFRTEPGEHLTVGERRVTRDPLLPLGLDSHRYRCCGNGVVADVGEWIGQRLLASLDDVA